MNRRHWIQTCAAATALPLCHKQDDPNPTTKPVVMTVNGPIDFARLGIALTHEHILVDFIGADRAKPDRYDRAEVEKTVLPYLKQLRDRGCTTFFDCTPAHLGRDPVLLKNLAKASGLQIVTNTGYYGANGGKHLPPHVQTESAEQIATRWVNEWKNGIGDTGVKPGFIKIGVDAGPLSEVGKKLVAAAARAHRETGLTIVSHTGNAAAAVAQLELFIQLDIDPSAWVWAHAQNEIDSQVHLRAAELGAWISIDGISPSSIGASVTFVDTLRRGQMLGRILISQDAGWYHVGEPNGGKFAPYTTLFTQFIPALQKKGFADAEIAALLVDNPSQAFRIRRRVSDIVLPE